MSSTTDFKVFLLTKNAETELESYNFKFSDFEEDYMKISNDSTIGYVFDGPSRYPNSVEAFGFQDLQLKSINSSFLADYTIKSTGVNFNNSHNSQSIIFNTLISIQRKKLNTMCDSYENESSVYDSDTEDTSSDSMEDLMIGSLKNQPPTFTKAQQQVIDRSDALLDKPLIELCNCINESWFCDEGNRYKLSGYIYKTMDKKIDGLYTYLKILNNRAPALDKANETRTYNNWGVSKTICKYNMMRLKQIAAGHNLDKYNQWKTLYIATPVKDEPKSKDKLKEALFEITDGEYKREFLTGCIYKKCCEYYYKPLYNTPLEFLNAIFADEPLWHEIKSREMAELISFIKNVIHPKFPFVKLDYDFIGFRNGVYDLSTATFIPIDEIKVNIQTRTLIDVDFKIGEAPLLDSYLSYQFNAETIEFIYFLLGRTMTRVRDRFDIMVMLYGEGGSGKSLAGNLIKYCHGSKNVGILSNSFQNQFGLSEWVDKQLVFCDDMPSNLAKTIPKADFLSMMTRGSLSCPVKGKGSIEVHDWDIPTIMNTNKLPNYRDESGEIVRRIMLINFTKVIEESMRNCSLEDQIKSNEYPTFLHRCRSTYLRYIETYQGVGIETFCPTEFIENRNLLRSECNSSYQFALERCVYAEGEFTSVPTINKSFKLHLKNLYNLSKAAKDNINVPNILLVDSRFIYKKEKICRFCDAPHKKGCCEAYNRTARTSRDLIYNMRIRPTSEELRENELSEFRSHN